MSRHDRTQRIIDEADAALLKPSDPQEPTMETHGRLVVHARSGRCPGCGEPIPPDGPDAPMGMTGAQLAKAGRTACLCEHCGSPLRRWKRIPKNAPECRACGEKVAGGSPQAESVLCWMCTYKGLAALEAGKVKPSRKGHKCMDCGAPLPLSRQRLGRCEKCKLRRRRESFRNSKRRAKHLSTVKGAQTPANTGSNDPENGHTGLNSTSMIWSS